MALIAEAALDGYSTDSRIGVEQEPRRMFDSLAPAVLTRLQTGALSERTTKMRRMDADAARQIGYARGRPVEARGGVYPLRHFRRGPPQMACENSPVKRARDVPR